MLGWFGRSTPSLPRPEGDYLIPANRRGLHPARRLVPALPGRPGHPARRPGGASTPERRSGGSRVLHLGSPRAENPSATTTRPRRQVRRPRSSCWLLLGLGLLIGGPLRRRPLRRCGQGAARHHRLRRQHRWPPAGRGRPAAAGGPGRAGRPRRSRRPSTASRVSVDPDAAGLAVDYDASVAEAGGERSWDPVRLWNYFTGGDDLEAEVTVDEAAFDALRSPASTSSSARAPREGARRLRRGPRSRRSSRGSAELDPAPPATRWCRPTSRTRTPRPALAMTDAVPTIDEATSPEARESFANPAVSGAVTLSFEGSAVSSRRRTTPPP